MILIDVKFLTASFLSGLINVIQGVIIIFDIYVDRTYYNVFEKILEVFKKCDCKIVFKVPKVFKKSISQRIITEIHECYGLVLYTLT